DLVQQPAVAPDRIGRAQQDEVGAILDQPIRIARGLVQQRDAAIGGVPWVQCAGGRAADAFVGAAGAEFGAADEWLPPRDCNAGDHVQVNLASVRACNASRVRPAIMSRTTKPPGVTSSTARSV